jgi:hypothetical protein
MDETKKDSPLEGADRWSASEKAIIQGVHNLRIPGLCRWIFI